MSENIEVADDGEYRVASPPDQLYTMGVGPCVAVAIVDHGSDEAYLFHAPGIASSSLDEGLKEMLRDAARGTGPFAITIAGADIGDPSTEADWAHAQSLVAAAFPKIAPTLHRNLAGMACDVEVDPASHTITVI